MGQLVEGEIPQIFNGVSRQPDSVRYPGQVEDAVNVQFSVETGGFTKRLGSRLKTKLSGFSTGSPRQLHVINRDSTERYRVVLSSGSIRVFDDAYTERTVSADSANLAWLTDDPSNFVMMTALDYTFIAKKTQVVAMSSTVAPAAPAIAVLYVAAVPDISAAVAYVVRVNGSVVGSYSASISSDTTTTIATHLVTSLTSGLGSGFTVTQSGSYIFLEHTNGIAFTVSTDSPRGDTSLVSYVSTVTDATLAPAKAIDGMMLQVKNVAGTSFWIKFQANDTSSGEGIWVEAAAPGTKVAFDATTMPRALIRESDGTFKLQTLTWNQKTVGGDVDVPTPEFVGSTIQDLIFSRDRLGFVAGETTYFSASGDYFRFWPASAVELTDDDPFGLTNTTNSVSRFYFAVPYRRSIFVMGDNAQFEIGGTLLTPSQASIDLATSYSASPQCRPIAIGDELYFPAEVGKIASVMSYVFDEASVSETATDVSKHVQGYIPTPVLEMVGDPVRGQLMLLSGADRTSLYVHRFYYQGQDRVQSAFGRYSFAYNILSIQSIDGVVILLAEWKDAVWLMELPSVEDIYGDYSWTPRLDHHQFLTGTYNADTGLTTWDLGYAPDDPVAITSNLWPTTQQMLSIPLTISGNTVTALGDWSAHPMMIGENYDSHVDLSQQFLRDQNNASIISGRLQLRTMSFRYTDSGYFTVQVIPDDERDPRTWVFTGRTLGSSANQVQHFSILSGTYRFGVKCNAETVTIRVGSDKFMPFTIVSAVWAGFFNEVTRQG